jgi:hypothetical protein
MRRRLLAVAAGALGVALLSACYGGTGTVYVGVSGPGPWVGYPYPYPGVPGVTVGYPPYYWDDDADEEPQEDADAADADPRSVEADGSAEDALPVAEPR